MIKVLVNGAFGRMGSEVVRMVTANPELELVGGVDINAAGKSLPDGKPVFTNIGEALEAVKADVVVDFTRPDVVMDSLRIILKKGVRAVVGTTGFTDERLAEVKELAEANNTAALIVPNFALGAVVMIKLATEAAKYFKDVEIIEKHHDQKLDAPSGTAILTAQKIGAVREAHKQGHPNERETLAGSRGGDIDGIRTIPSTANATCRAWPWPARRSVPVRGWGTVWIRFWINRRNLRRCLLHCCGAGGSLN